ncbi:MAG TPA: copper chaperone PCu(A)C [Trebonia sp.]|nr:copper chaperone PCu(A)C [Trebonia sp.]
MTATDARPARQATGQAAGRGGLAEAARAAAGPLICAVLLIGALSAWTAVGGAGTLTRARLQVTLSAVPMQGFTARAAAKAGSARVYLDIRNLDSTPDQLIAIRSPIASRIVLVTGGLTGGRPTVVRALAVPGDGTLDLSPLGDGAILEDPAPYFSRSSVPLTLVFRDAGQVTINAAVTPPGTP